MSALARINRNNETPSDAVSIIKTAKVNGCWNFHRRNQNFFTPEKFEKEWQTVVQWRRRKPTNPQPILQNPI